MGKWGVIMLWLILFVIVLFFGGTYCFYWIAFYNPESRHLEPVRTKWSRHFRREEMLSQSMEALPFEQVWITSRDGLRLCGRYYHICHGAPLLIQFHGYRGNGFRDCSAGNHVARHLGYNTLVVDQRAHGMSQGDTMTFGIRERWDCVCWAEYARNRFGPEIPIFLYGVSMGAATVLMTQELPLPENVAGIIGDCPYSSPVGIIRKICRDIHIPEFLSVPLGRAAARLWGHFSLTEASAEEAVKHGKIPMLLIHGTEDKYILPEMSREIQANCVVECFLELFPGATHAGSCLTDMGRYSKVVASFVDFCLERK